MPALMQHGGRAARQHAGRDEARTWVCGPDSGVRDMWACDDGDGAEGCGGDGAVARGTVPPAAAAAAAAADAAAAVGAGDPLRGPPASREADGAGGAWAACGAGDGVLAGGGVAP
jgi:hypothetical protein